MHSPSYHERIRSTLTRKRTAIIRQGLREGRKKAELENLDFIRDFREALHALNQAKINLIDEITQLIIEKKLAEDPDIIVSMTKNVLKQVTEYADVEISLHPLDAAHLKSFLGQNQFMGDSARKLTLLEDASFMRGSIVMKAHKSIVDAHIRTQIERARELIIFEINHGRAC